MNFRIQYRISEVSEMYDWVIIGGGIHGCCFANHLVKKNILKEDILIIDMHSKPLYQWMKTTELIGMKYLRSPFVHQIDIDPLSLKYYSKNNDYVSAFKGEFKRPRLDMFNQHCIDTIKQNGIDNRFKQGMVTKLSKMNKYWEIGLLNGSKIRSKNVVIATGVNHTPYYPEWVKEYRNDNNIQHIFDANDNVLNKGNIVIIGGGMSAAHLACTLCDEYSDKTVTLIKRHPFRVHTFDSDPGWLGPKYLEKFNKESDYSKRREMINSARHKGSITKDLNIRIKKLSRNRKLNIQTGIISKVEKNNDNYTIYLDDHSSINTDAIVLATGAANNLLRSLG